MKNTLSMAMFSRRSITEPLARELITALSNFGGGLMCPDKCNENEPLRKPFDPANIDEPVRWLDQPHGTFFYRKGRPAHVAGEIWNRTHPPTARFPSPLFNNYWTGRFDGKWAAKVGVDRVEGFVSEIFRIAGADFALLTTEIDLKAKNTNARSYSFQGLDLGLGIPGLYWVNLFSEELARWLSLSEIPKELAEPRPLASGGLSLKFCESPDHCTNLDVLQKQRAAIDWLGPDRFFDIRFSNRKLESPDWGPMADVRTMVV